MSDIHISDPDFWKPLSGKPSPFRVVSVEDIRSGKYRLEPTVKSTVVLCGCGWGSLKMPVTEVPSVCPICGSPLSE